jgi:hypothetical protein
MATKGGNQKSRKANPMLTKNGKERLGPLNIEQLEKLLSNARKKHAPKIQRRIAELKSRPGFVEVVEVSAEEAAVVESVL